MLVGDEGATEVPKVPELPEVPEGELFEAEPDGDATPTAVAVARAEDELPLRALAQKLWNGKS